MYYAVQVKGGTEDKVIQSINERIDPSFYIAAFTPFREMSRKFRGTWVVRKEKIFPGYIFVDTQNIKDVSVGLIRIPEFARVLGKDNVVHDFVPLSDLECRTIDLLCGRDTQYTAKISEVNIKEGKIARILSGALMGNEGLIKKVNLHRREALISIEMFNRSTDVLVGIDIIEPKDD